jgi:glycopeptide antibiotics resistance protein
MIRYIVNGIMVIVFASNLTDKNVSNPNSSQSCPFNIRPQQCNRDIP